MKYRMSILHIKFLTNDIKIGILIGALPKFITGEGGKELIMRLYIIYV